MADDLNDFLSVNEIRDRIRNRVWTLTGSTEAQNGNSASCHEQNPALAQHRLNELRRNVRNATALIKDVGAITPRPPGWKNDAVQYVKKSVRLFLSWFLRPLRQFNSAMLASLSEIVHILEELQTELRSISQRVEGLEASVTGAQSMSGPRREEEREHEGPQVDRPASEILVRINELQNQLETLSKSVRESLENHRTLHS
jgi:hypothetical protein